MAAKFWRRRKKAPEDDLVNPDPNRMPQHIAIIMDGNGRWARKRGLPRTFGHKAGAEVLREISAEAANLGIRYLTCLLYTSDAADE